MTALVLFMGLTVVMQSSSALTVTVEPNAANIASTATVTYTMVVHFATDDFIPIVQMRLLVEGPANGGGPGPLYKAFAWSVVGSSAGGILSNNGCSALTVVLANTGLATVAGYGFQGSATYLGRHSGYGYAAPDSALGTTGGRGTAGYGSSPYNTAGTQRAEVDTDVFAGYGTGAGYGYSAGEGVLTYTISFPATCLGDGVYRVTGEVNADYWSFQSAASTITIGGTSAGGGGGGGASTGTGSVGTGAGQTQTVTATATTAPAGADAAYTVTIAAASAGNTIVVNTGNAVLPSVTFVAAADLTNAVISVVVYSPSNAPAGAPSLPAGLDVAAFFEITITSPSGSVQSIVLSVSLTPAEVPDAAKGVVLRGVNNQWVVESKLVLTLQNGRYVGTGTAGCCSVFAVAFDTTPPQVALTVPGTTVTGVETLKATATDNLQLTKVDFFVDGVLKGTDTSSPYEYSFDGRTVNPGEHTVKAVATDFVGNTAEDSKQVSSEGGTEGPTPTGGGKGGVPGWVWFLIVILVVALIVGAVVMSGKKK